MSLPRNRPGVEEGVFRLPAGSGTILRQGGDTSGETALITYVHWPRQTHGSVLSGKLTWTGLHGTDLQEDPFGSILRVADHPLEAWRRHFERQSTRPSAHQALCLTKPVNAA